MSESIASAATDEIVSGAVVAPDAGAGAGPEALAGWEVSFDVAALALALGARTRPEELD
jgi:hypothetical protein